jgi:hypothetical protein
MGCTPLTYHLPANLVTQRDHVRSSRLWRHQETVNHQIGVVDDSSDLPRVIDGVWLREIVRARIVKSRDGAIRVPPETVRVAILSVICSADPSHDVDVGGKRALEGAVCGRIRRVGAGGANIKGRDLSVRATHEAAKHKIGIVAGDRSEIIDGVRGDVYSRNRY